MHARPSDTTCISPIRLLDVTLVTLSRAVCIPFNAKVGRAEALAASGIDVLDVGDVLPVPGKLRLVREIAQRVRGVALAACAQGDREQIAMAWEAIGDAEHPVLRVCITVSDWHREEEHRKSEPELLQAVSEQLSYARQLCPTVELVAQDATRCDHAVLCRFVETAIKHGARTVTLSDTVGYDRPFEYRLLFRSVVEQVAGIDTITLGVAAHHRDGEALEKTLAAIAAGARQVTVDESSGGHLTRAEVAVALQRLTRSPHDEKEHTIPPPSST